VAFRVGHFTIGPGLGRIAKHTRLYLYHYNFCN
jgi:hypothetical protein